MKSENGMNKKYLKKKDEIVGENRKRGNISMWAYSVCFIIEIFCALFCLQIVWGIEEKCMFFFAIG